MSLRNFVFFVQEPDNEKRDEEGDQKDASSASSSEYEESEIDEFCKEQFGEDGKYIFEFFLVPSKSINCFILLRKRNHAL